MKGRFGELQKDAARVVSLGICAEDGDPELASNTAGQAQEGTNHE